MRFLIVLLGFSCFVRAQSDSSNSVPLVGIHFTGQLPFADLAKRFGPNLSAGGSFLYKTSRNYIFGIDASYMFGNEVKEDVLTQLKTPEGFVVDNEGFAADLRVTQRGFGLHLVGGKIFRFLSANPNSGLMVTVGVGGLQHKIRLYDAQQKIAAIRGELAYGYDRLSAGVSFSQFVGYLFLSQNRLSNFYFGVEAFEAFTKSLRKFNYDTGMPDTARRLDVLTGIRFGWILPLYQKRPNEFYYN